MKVGRIASIHRYPVKSMLGETLDEAELGAAGIPGDRAWAVRDEARGGIVGAKKIPELMACAARYSDPPRGGAPAPAAEIALPDGGSFPSNAPDAGARLSAAIGRELTVWPLLPADALDHYRRAAPDNPDFEKELRAIFARTPDEPLPDIGKFPPEILQYESPPGTYFDAFPLLVVTTTSLATLQAKAPDARFDARRFRPNLLVEFEDGDEGGLPEAGWAGARLRVGAATLAVAMACPRCVMTTHGFADLPQDPTIMRTLVREAEGNLGAYASVAEPGLVRVGDAVSLERV